MMESDSFRDAMFAALGYAPAQIIGDGKIHRFSTNGKKHDTAGWYLFFDDEFPAGEFGDWRTGEQHTWHNGAARDFSPADLDRIKEKRAASEKEKAEGYTRAKQEAQAIWAKAKEADPHHPYLVRKGIAPHGLREDADGRLIVPVRVAGEITSIQTIPEEGTKLSLEGGRISGGVFWLGQPGETIVEAEGFATAATIHELRGLPVVIAFCSGNLPDVAQAVRAEYPAARIIIAADDDFKTEREKGFNPGIRKAREAAEAIGGIVAIPPFNRANGEDGSDWNDLAAARGVEAAKAAFDAVVKDSDPLETDNAQRADTKKKKKPGRQRGFRMTAKGLVWADPDAPPESEKPEIVISGAFEIVAECRDDDGKSWGTLLRWNDPDGRPHDWAMPRSLLAGHGLEVRPALLDGGLYVAAGNKSRNPLTTYLASEHVNARARAVSSIGWFGHVFVFPNASIGDAEDEHVIF